MISTPPEWKKVLIKNPKRLVELATSTDFQKIVEKSNREYLHWDKFRYQKFPDGIDPDSAWAYLKMIRTSASEILPITDAQSNPFSIFVTKESQKILSFIDSYTSGTIVSNEPMPHGQQKDRLIINGLMEEAISSSQIEGANTTRKAAKEMLELKRRPRNKDERMILNNFEAMSRLEDWKDRELNDDFLLELHMILTKGIMDNAEDEGRFRYDEDDVVVADKYTGNVVHYPPKIEEAKQQLRQLYKFANSDDDENYIHPFVKASILHFCLGYIHPFVDGNGRCARALFYWHLIKNDYWVFKFLPISLQIKKKDWRPGYDKAYQFVETDGGDITYFLSYKVKLAKNAIEDFIKYLQKKQKEASKLRDQLLTDGQINERQLAAIKLLKDNPLLEIDLEMHKKRFAVAYQTARVDLIELAERGILKQVLRGKKYIFTRGEKFPLS